MSNELTPARNILIGDTGYDWAKYGYCLTLLNTSRNKQLTKERKEKMERLLGIGEKAEL